MGCSPHAVHSGSRWADRDFDSLPAPDCIWQLSAGRDVMLRASPILGPQTGGRGKAVGTLVFLAVIGIMVVIGLQVHARVQQSMSRTTGSR